MASPISFGDAYLMGSLAFKLGQAFTKGRKSAPAEFRELENQLYSLSSALCALKDAPAHTKDAVQIDPARLVGVAQPRHSGSGETITVMLQSCEEALKHLQDMVEKYTCLSESKDPSKPPVKRWSREFLMTNWKKVAWTKEGGDLATLRSQLTVHTNSLNLVLGVVINSQATRIENGVDQATVMLREIHEWFTANLKDASPGKHPSTTGAQADLHRTVASQVSLNGLTFELFADNGRDENPSLVCKSATVHPSWSARQTGASHRELFLCQCEGSTVQHPKVAAYALSPWSLPVKVAGKEHSWMLYKATDTTNNRLVSLILRHIPINCLQAFEQLFVRELALARASDMLRRGHGTMLAYSSPNSNEDRVLHITGDLNSICKSVTGIKFSTGEKSYARAGIESINCLHYRSFHTGLASSLAKFSTMDDAINHSYVEYAEIVIHYESKSSRAEDVSSTTLQMRTKNDLRLNRDQGSVSLKNIQCTSTTENGLPDDVGNLDVTFQLSNTQAAERFHQKLDDMRMELFIMGLQNPKKEERTLLKLQASRAQSEAFDISDADITVVQNTVTDRYRLIIVSRNGCSIVSQDLAEDFLDSLRTPGTRPNFASKTYVVQIDESGARGLGLYKRGFEYLEFPSAQADRLFELGLATISGSLPMRMLHDVE